LGKPAVIRDSEIDLIKAFLGEHVNIEIEKTRVNVHMNDKIKVIGGLLKERKGEVLTVKNRTAKVALPSLGYIMYAEVDIANIEVMKHVIPAEVSMSYPLSMAQ
jgi:transcription antitermination factor NusG